MLKQIDGGHNMRSMPQQLKANYIGYGVGLELTCMNPIGFNNLPKKGEG